MKILIVDDNEEFRSGVRSFLETHTNYEVVGQAKDGPEAFALLQIVHPDLVLLDISMPRMSGFEAANVIKAVSPDTKIVFLTVHEEATFQAIAETISVDGYVCKSSLKSELPRVLQAIDNSGNLQTHA